MPVGAKQTFEEIDMVRGHLITSYGVFGHTGALGFYPQPSDAQHKEFNNAQPD
jgi:hypothetical protein